MKPAVINNNSETPTQTHHEQSTNTNNQANNGQPNSDHSRRFPQFRQHGFGFDDPDGDVFADMGLRSRLNRMGSPFDWSARKRRGSGQSAGTADPYAHYFDDVDFPHFGSTWDAFSRMGKRSQQPHETNANDRGGFFNYVPPEFRQYVPEHFGGYFRQHSGQPYMPQQQQPHEQPHQQQQKQQQQTQPPGAQSSNSKSNLCDAAIQTDDSGIRNGSNNTENDNRNGMNVNKTANAASSSSSSTPYGGDASAPAGNNQNQYHQQGPNYGAHDQGQQYGRQYQQPYGWSQPPQQSQHYPNPQQKQSQQQQTTPTPAQPQQQQQQQHPQQQQHASQEGFVRNVPIVFEETGTPISRESSAPQASQTASNKPRPEPLNKDSFASNQPIPADQPIPCPPPSSHNQQQPEQQHSDGSAPPQTPHTADCISKIQAIQRDVLELMLAVEQFGGKRGDKDYMYLDEMLTRNLLKLDTIDTNGKESIRLARKEAIKCIQTSIAVLEAKSDLHLNEKRESVDQSNENTTAENISDAAPTAAADQPAEKMDSEEAKCETSTAQNNSEQVDSNASEIPKVENIRIEDQQTNDAEQKNKSDDKKP